MITPPDGFAAVPNVGSQLERAIRAWFIICGAGTINSNYVSMESRPRVPPLNDILAHKSNEAEINSREESFTVMISSEFPSVQQPNDPEGYNWVSINNWIGLVMAALSITGNGGQDYRATCEAITDAGRNLAIDPTDGADPLAVTFAANNADMANFTCTFLRYLGCVRVKKADGGLYFVEERNFEIHACPYNIPDFLNY